MMKYRSEYLYEYAKEHIPDRDVYPVFVPSYNRPNAKLLEKALQEPSFPVILCIREEQEEMYSRYKNRIPTLLLRGVSDLAETREQILQIAAQFYDNIFMMDDDITELDFLIPSQTSGGKDSMRSSRLCTGSSPRYIDILKMWQCLIQNDKYKDLLAMSSIMYRPDSWHMKNKDKEQEYNSGVMSQCIHINTKLIREKDIHYKPMREVGVEDYSFQFDVMSSGLLTAVFTDLMYNCPAINSVPGGCENAHGMDHVERYKMYLEVSKKHYGNHPGIKYVKTRSTGWDTVKFNWKYWRRT